MTDAPTIRLVFTIVALTLLVLLYAALYRPTRAAYARRWCESLALFLAGDALYFADGTAWQRYANPAGDVLIVVGASLTYVGASSLRDVRPRWWQLALGPAAVAVASALDHPERNTWAGGAVFLAAVGAYFLLAGTSMWLLSSTMSGRTGIDGVYRLLARALGITIDALALFYFGRAASLLIQGQSGWWFTTFFGTSTTLLLQVVLLVVVGFTVSALSNEQRVLELRVRASLDGLTGVLNHAEFYNQARDRLAECQRSRVECVLVMADLDHFKHINDTFGHSAGDRVLRSFAKACQSVVGEDGLVGRLGGEEFGILLPHTQPAYAERLTRRISHEYRFAAPVAGTETTASFGIAAMPSDGEADLETLVARADAALYRAKAAGRDRAVHYRNSDTA